MEDLINIKNIHDYDDKFYNDFLNTIKDEKKEKIKKVIKEDEKKRKILGEYLFYDLLKEIDIDYNDVLIKYNEHGKPLIDNYDIYYNISHKDDYSVCIISSKKVGIDIEKIKETDNKVLRFIATEKENIKSDEDYTFLYTLKEAYYKMIGTGLGNFKDIEFYITNEGIKSNKNIEIKSIKNDDCIISIIKDAC